MKIANSKHKTSRKRTSKCCKIITEKHNNQKQIKSWIDKKIIIISKFMKRRTKNRIYSREIITCNYLIWTCAFLLMLDRRRTIQISLWFCTFQRLFFSIVTQRLKEFPFNNFYFTDAPVSHSTIKYLKKWHKFQLRNTKIHWNSFAFLFYF